MNTQAVEWLERFREPVYEEIHIPRGLFQAKPDHRADCRCETGEGAIWTQADSAAKWRAP